MTLPPMLLCSMRTGRFVDGYKVFLISDHWNDEDIYSGEVGFEWT